MGRIFSMLFAFIFLVTAGYAGAQMNNSPFNDPTFRVTEKVVHLLNDPHVSWKALLYFINPFFDAVDASTSYKGLPIRVVMDQQGYATITLGGESKTVFHPNSMEATALRIAIKARWGTEIARREVNVLHNALSFINDTLAAKHKGTCFVLNETQDVYAWRAEMLHALAYCYKARMFRWDSQDMGKLEYQDRCLCFYLDPDLQNITVSFRGEWTKMCGFPLNEEDLRAVGLFDRMKKEQEKRYKEDHTTKLAFVDFVLGKQNGVVTPGQLDQKCNEAMVRVFSGTMTPTPRFTFDERGVFTVSIGTFEIIPYSRTCYALDVYCHNTGGYAFVLMTGVENKAYVKSVYNTYYEKSGWSARDKIDEQIRNSVATLFLNL
ncbi:MAG: hypothetical protein KGN01_03255 [Patescibacteria group bacterium]|nr:hypothetical protein [Patescibacteria group bacterium]